MAIIEDLKQKVVDSEQIVKDTRRMYLEMKTALKIEENKLKYVKANFNRSHRNWVKAKKLLVKSKSKLSRYPSERRYWAKNNMDKVMDLIEKSPDYSKHFCGGEEVWKPVCHECKLIEVKKSEAIKEAERQGLWNTTTGVSHLKVSE